MPNFYFKPQTKNREVETQPLVKLWITKKIQSNFIDEMKPSYTDIVEKFTKKCLIKDKNKLNCFPKLRGLFLKLN